MGRGLAWRGCPIVSVPYIPLGKQIHGLLLVYPGLQLCRTSSWSVLFFALSKVSFQAFARMRTSNCLLLECGVGEESVPFLKQLSPSSYIATTSFLFLPFQKYLGPLKTLQLIWLVLYIFSTAGLWFNFLDLPSPFLFICLLSCFQNLVTIASSPVFPGLFSLSCLCLKGSIKTNSWL